MRSADILHLLDHSLRAEGVQIFIGQSPDTPSLDDCSVVTAPTRSTTKSSASSGHRPDAHGL